MPRHSHSDSVIHIGFTGSRKGMSGVQQVLLRRCLDALTAAPHRITIHHGGCKGSDETMHQIALARGYNIVIHPADQRLVPPESQMPPHTYNPNDLRNDLTDAHRILIRDIHPPLPPLRRNLHIVLNSDMIFATPDFNGNRSRSGTWATVRLARKRNKMVRILYPEAAQNDSYGQE